MLLTRLRVSPCIALVVFSSSGRVHVSVSPSCSMTMVPGISRESVPFGPFTAMLRPSIVTSTPAGTVMGDLPMRDMVPTSPSPAWSPDVTHDLAADVALARLAVGHEAVGGGQDGDTETTEHSGHGVGVAVHPQARRRDATQAHDRAVTIGGVLHLDGQDVPHPLGGRRGLVPGDVALLLEELSQCDLLLGRGHGHLVVLGRVRVANPGEHVGDRISHHDVDSSPARLRQTGDLAGVGELAQAHTAEAELAVDGTGPATAAAAGVAANLELRLRIGLVDQCFLCHLSRLGSLLLAAVARATVLLLAGLVVGVGALLEGKAERIEQGLAALVVGRGGHDGDVHAPCVIGLVGVDLGEHRLLVEAEGVVATTVPGMGGQAAEVTDPGDRHRDQTVEELPHAVTAQRDLHADRLALAELE